MEKASILKIIKEIILDYLNSLISRDEVVERLINKVCMIDVLEYNDEFISDCFFALYHINEDGYETTNSELVYLRGCLENKYKFSREDRDNFIKVNHCKY